MVGGYNDWEKHRMNNSTLKKNVSIKQVDWSSPFDAENQTGPVDNHSGQVQWYTGTSPSPLDAPQTNPTHNSMNYQSIGSSAGMMSERKGGNQKSHPTLPNSVGRDPTEDDFFQSDAAALLHHVQSSRSVPDGRNAQFPSIRENNTKTQTTDGMNGVVAGEPFTPPPGNSSNQWAPANPPGTTNEESSTGNSSDTHTPGQDPHQGMQNGQQNQAPHNNHQQYGSGKMKTGGKVYAMAGQNNLASPENSPPSSRSGSNSNSGNSSGNTSGSCPVVQRRMVTQAPMFPPPSQITTPRQLEQQQQQQQQHQMPVANGGQWQVAAPVQQPADVSMRMSPTGHIRHGGLMYRQVDPLPPVTTGYEVGYVNMGTPMEPMGYNYPPQENGALPGTNMMPCGRVGPNAVGEERSTIMLRNVPYDARQRGVLKLLLDNGFNATFDFFYCPLDFRSRNNLGYAFVNFKSPYLAGQFVQHFDGFRVMDRPGWEKELRVCWARVQGLTANVDHYRNSPVNDMPEEFKPMLFDESGGQYPFPAPDPRPGSPNVPIEASDSQSMPAHSNGASGTIVVRPRERRRLQMHAQSQGKPSSVSGTSAASNMVMSNAGPAARRAANRPDGYPPNPQPHKLFVGGMSPDTTNITLWRYMSHFGEVAEAEVLLDHHTGRSRTFGFCSFYDPAAAREALNKKEHFLDGRSVVVRPYTSFAGPTSTNRQISSPQVSMANGGQHQQAPVAPPQQEAPQLQTVQNMYPQQTHVQPQTFQGAVYTTQYPPQQMGQMPSQNMAVQGNNSGSYYPPPPPQVQTAFVQGSQMMNRPTYPSYAVYATSQSQPETYQQQGAGMVNGAGASMQQARPGMTSTAQSNMSYSRAYHGDY